jgi:Uma2 family endonuclease
MSEGTMSMPHTWTYSEYAALPEDGNRYEVIDGEVLVTPAPTTGHQRILGNLFRIVAAYCEEQGIGWAYFDVDLLFRTGQFMRPDLLVVPTAHRAGVTARGVELAPLLIVEVLSPSSASMDRVKKPRCYADFGVAEYWAVDPRLKIVDVWRYHSGATAPERVAGTLTWQPTAAAAPLVMDLEHVFAPI